MKLIINIPEHDKNVIERFVRGDGCEDMPPSIIENLIRAIYFATPLEKHDAEVIKETVASVWGKPPYTEVLDEIRAEVAGKKQKINFKGLDSYEKAQAETYLSTLNDILRIIDKYKGGNKE